MSRFDVIVATVCVVAIISLPLARRYDESPALEKVSIGLLILASVLAGIRGYLALFGGD